MYTKDGHKFTGEEVHHMKHPGNFKRRDIEDIFGFTDNGLASRCFSRLVRHMKKKLGIPSYE
jgi:hypothetical protein